MFFRWLSCSFPLGFSGLTALLFSCWVVGWQAQAQASFQNFFVRKNNYPLDLSIALRPHNHDSLLFVADFLLPDSVQVTDSKYFNNASVLRLTIYLQANTKFSAAEYKYHIGEITATQVFGKNWGKITMPLLIPAEPFVVEAAVEIGALKGYHRYYAAPPASYRWPLSLQPVATCYGKDSITISYANRQVLLDEYPVPSKPPPPPYLAARRKPSVSQPISRNKVLATPTTYFSNTPKCIVLKNKPSDTLSYSLFYGSVDFPEPTTLAGLISSLVYICSPAEMRYFQEYQSKKMLDDFWLEVGGNANRARERIAEFYERIATGNRLFADFVPGYLTDRGMIWCVFGRPDAITYQPNREIWYYDSPPGQANPINFIFARYPHQLSTNHFELIREPNYEAIWFTAINNWRNGIIKK